jgi:hypothetical protein
MRRLVADTYGLDPSGRRELLDVLDADIARSGEFVRRRVEAGDPNFIRDVERPWRPGAVRSAATLVA